jgi:diguanylate cyclase (GGDEF)-like protein/PAS domain S-box-containing protein
MIDNPKLQNLDLTLSLPRSATPTLVGNAASFYVDELSAPYAAQFDEAGMRSFLQIPLVVQDKLWGSLTFIDSGKTPRLWSWAESDTLKTLAGLIGIAITRAQYVKELADANMIVQNSPTILYRLRGEPSFPLIYISHNITKFGHDPEKLIGTGDWATTLVDPADRAKIVEAMTRALEKDAQPASIEFRLRTGSGGYRWVENHYTPVRDKKDGRLIEVEGIVIDITERKAAEEKIAQLARTDALTGLANRATFIDRLEQSFSASRRGASPFATLYIDLDRFKQVNDTLGHPVGDLLLRQVAERLKGSCREGDVVARLGGDEFAILQMDVLDPANAGTLAAKIQQALAMPYLISGSEINYITASVGISPYTSSSTGPDVMLVQADRALYRSKEEGRNQFRFYSEDLDRQVRERVALAAELRNALDRSELELSYEPQVDVASGEVVRVEALVRWRHPKRGMIDTEAFLPTAEKAGLMPAVGTWVLDQVCRQMKTWRDTGTKCPIVAIGLSLSQVKSARELLRAVVQFTTRWDIKPKELEFDVTEATLAHATVMQNDVLSQLQLLGARIAIDKFGTEYSSFDYVRAYHVSHIKLAKSFLEGAATDPERAATVRAIFNIAHELDIGVVAAEADSMRHRALVQVAT